MRTSVFGIRHLSHLDRFSQLIEIGHLLQLGQLFGWIEGETYLIRNDPWSWLKTDPV